MNTRPSKPSPISLEGATRLCERTQTDGYNNEREGLLVVLLIAAAATVLPRTEAAEHMVGNSTGWVVPTSDAAFYSSWAASKNFSVGDVLGEQFS
jgi:hypothetical protein